MTQYTNSDTNIEWDFQQLKGTDLEIALMKRKINDIIVNGSKINNEPNCNMIINGLWLGSYEAAFDQKFILDNHITTIINVSVDLPNVFSDRTHNVSYHNYKISEKNDNEPLLFDIFNSSSLIIANELSKGNNVLVHCKRGHHRSASIVVFYLMKSHDVQLTTAINFIKTIRPNCFRRFIQMLNVLVDIESEKHI